MEYLKKMLEEENETKYLVICCLEMLALDHFKYYRLIFGLSLSCYKNCGELKNQRAPLWFENFARFAILISSVGDQCI